MYTLSRWSVISLIATACFAAWLLFTPFTSQAFFTSDPVPVTGYAWSSNIGWIAVNGANHQLTINTDGTITGYAWSSNIGWVKFGGLSNFPSGGGTVTQNARLVDVGGGNYELRGWARACAGTTSGTCSTMASRSDGWDGWIALTGTGHTVRFSFSGVATNSFAWGGPVMGWIDMFSHVTYNATTSTPTATMNVTGCQVALGNSSCIGGINWTMTNVTNPSVTQSSPVNNTLSTAVSSGSDNNITMNLNQTYTYNAIRDNTVVMDTASVNINCVANASPTGGVCQCNSGYQPDSSGLVCEAIPTITPVMVFALNQSLIRKGDTVTFTIRVAGANPVCTVRGPGIAGEVPIPGIDGSEIASPTDFTYTSGNIDNFARFFLTCSGIYASEETIEQSVRVIPTFQEQ